MNIARFCSLSSLHSNTVRAGELLPDSDRAFIALALSLVIFGIPFLWMMITPEAKAERYHLLANAPDGCRAEVWVKGEKGDSLARLMEPHKRGPSTFFRAVIIHERLNSTRLPESVRTPQGNCRITRWNLEIGGVQTDSVKR